MVYLQQIKNQLCELYWICDLFVLTERLKPWLYWRDLRRTDKSFDLCTLRQCRLKSKWTSLLDISLCKSNKGKWKSILSTKFKNILLISKDGPSHTFIYYAQYVYPETCNEYSYKLQITCNCTTNLKTSGHATNVFKIHTVTPEPTLEICITLYVRNRFLHNIILWNTDVKFPLLPQASTVETTLKSSGFFFAVYLTVFCGIYTVLAYQLFFQFRFCLDRGSPRELIRWTLSVTYLMCNGT